MSDIIPIKDAKDAEAVRGVLQTLSAAEWSPLIQSEIDHQRCRIQQWEIRERIMSLPGTDTRSQTDTVEDANPQADQVDVEREEPKGDDPPATVKPRNMASEDLKRDAIETLKQASREHLRSIRSMGEQPRNGSSVSGPTRHQKEMVSANLKYALGAHREYALEEMQRIIRDGVES